MLIYTAMAAYLLAFIFELFRLGRTAKGFFFIAFIISIGSFVYRWVHTGHVPLQNLFELFIAMGAAVYLISIICERFLNIHQRIVDMLIGVIVLFPAGFVFSEMPQQLPPALGLFPNPVPSLRPTYHLDLAPNPPVPAYLAATRL